MSVVFGFFLVIILSVLLDVNILKAVIIAFVVALVLYECESEKDYDRSYRRHVSSVVTDEQSQQPIVMTERTPIGLSPFLISRN